jgi:hypothetical protein
MNPSYSTLLDARIANISRVTELWENTYLSAETIALQTGLSLHLVVTIVEETGVKRLRSEPLGTSGGTFGIENAQVTTIMHLYNTTTLSVKAISAHRGIFYRYHQVLKVIKANTTKEERELRRIKGVRLRGGVDVFTKRIT